MDDSRIRSKTAQFPFENGLVWTGPYLDFLHTVSKFLHTSKHPSCLTGTEVEQARPNMFTFSKESNLRSKSEVINLHSLSLNSRFLINEKLCATLSIFLFEVVFHTDIVLTQYARKIHIEGVFRVFMNQKCVIFCNRFQLLIN